MRFQRCTYRFLMTPVRMEHGRTSKYARVVQNSTWRRRNRKYLQVRGCLVQWNTTRHRAMHARYRNQHFDVETGSSYKLGWEQGRNAILTATYLGFRGCLDDWNSSRQRNMHGWCHIQHCPNLSCKYFRFWCRHGLLKASIYKYSVQQRTGGYSNSTVVHRFSTRVVERYIVIERNMHVWYIIP